MKNDSKLKAGQIRDALLLVEFDIDIETIESWSTTQRQSAFTWAIMAHSKASDLPAINVPERPAHVGQHIGIERASIVATVGDDHVEIIGERVSIDRVGNDYVIKTLHSTPIIIEGRARMMFDAMRVWSLIRLTALLAEVSTEGAIINTAMLRKPEHRAQRLNE